ncbi:lysylphosphatidylglycerol synthase domain-containing protein [Acetobacter sp. AN02]|uniref:lysylphosphatidylglycerol synthase domain-containing protein n=1 Tax=Acetobacter sp. AN02 TaxID=2894186 RepID=UPI0024342C7D|nr:lysylphosphatidylglycerol synthase domain-containing protein [Acetobacter sp. AN02]MDG6094000.1 lysylphosphatidylglycerol synthase domain-containing protein [Acetobacter sp. AN02]
MRSLTILLALLGIAGLTAVVAWSGFGSVLAAVSGIGPGGFLITILCQLVVDTILGLAWHVAFPEISWLHLTGARMVRDAAGACLPFSQLGGMVIGTRATCRRPSADETKPAIDLTEATTLNIVDITTEVMGQIAFIILAVLLLMSHTTDHRLAGPVAAGAAVLALGVAGFIWTQHHGGSAVSRLARFFGRHIAGQWSSDIADSAGEIQNRLEAAWARTPRIAAAAAVHLLGWIASAAVLQITCILLHVHISFPQAVAIEGVTCGIMSASFFVPASLGVQEGAYTLLGSLFGIETATCVALSLLRRARELSIGIPVLIGWQILEMRALRRQNTRTQTARPGPARISPAGEPDYSPAEPDRSPEQVS